VKQSDTKNEMFLWRDIYYLSLYGYHG